MIGAERADAIGPPPARRYPRRRSTRAQGGLISDQDPAQIDQTTDFMWKATAAVATLASGFVAEKVVALGWRAISGKPAPREEDQLLNYKLAEIVTFAIISGATVTLVRELGLRQAAKWYSARRPDSPYAMRAISA